MSENQRSIPASILALAALPRLLVYFWATRRPDFFLHNDSFDYLGLAHELWLHHRYYYPPPISKPAFVFTPGYAFFLSPFMRLSAMPAFSIAFTQTLLGILSVLIVWKWLSLMADERGAWWGTFFFALDWVVLGHTPAILADSLMIFCLIVALYVFWKTRYSDSMWQLGSLGILWALPAMIKPIALYFPILISCIWRKSKRAWLAFLIGLSLFPGTWIFRNFTLTHSLVFSSMGGLHLLEYFAANIEALRTHRPWGVVADELRARCDAEHPQGFHDELEQSRAYGECAAPIIKAHPFLMIEHNGIGAVKIMGGTGTEMFWEWISCSPAPQVATSPTLSGRGTLALLRIHPTLVIFQTAYLLELAALYWFYLAGLWYLTRTARWSELGVLLPGVLYFLVLSSHTGYYRYRLPMMPFLVAGAAIALSRRNVLPPFADTRSS